MPTTSFEMYKNLLSAQSNVALTIFRFHKWTNFYLSNRKLGDEFRYVFDRKYTQRFMGNQLDRPSLLLKRNFIRDTTFNEEVVNQGQVFEQMHEQTYAMEQQCIASPSYDYAPKSQMIAGIHQERSKRER